MYNNLLTLNRVFSVVASVVLLVALLIPALQEALGMSNPRVLTVSLAVLAGSILLDRKLAKLAMAESLSSMVKRSDE